jgi:DNA-binding transcriptional LysR family regulator
VGFITTAAVRLLPEFLERAQRQAPHATFDIETGLSKDLQDKVATGQIDAAIVTDADGLPDALSERVLRKEPFVFATHRSLATDGLKGLLARHRFFHFMPDTGIGKSIAAEMRRHDRAEAAGTIVLDNLEAIMECVTSGLGFTLLPKPDVERYSTSDTVTLPTPSSLQRTLVLAIRRDSALSHRENALADLFA